MALSPRRWFQFHLLTGVVAMAVAGALLGLNASTRESELSGTKCEYAGWPVPNWFKTELPALPPGATSYEHDSYIVAYGVEFLYVNNGWNGKAVAINVACGLVLLLAAAALCEGYLRRRERNTS